MTNPFPRGVDPAIDVDDTTFTEMFEAAETVNGNLAVTAEGRLIIYGDGLDAARWVEQQPFNGFYIEVLDDNVIGFKFA